MRHDTTIPDDFKRCSGCKEVKPKSEFYKNKRSKTGTQSYCKRCQLEMQKTPEGRAKAIERATRYRERNPEKSRESNRLSSLRERQNHPDRLKEREKKRRIEHADKLRERNRDYREKNKGKKRKVNLERTRAYRNANPERDRRYSRRRRTRQLNIPFVEVPNMEAILFDIQNGYCLYCQCELFNGYNVDHIIPLALIDFLGDSHPGHTPSNLALACLDCNKRKMTFIVEEWVKDRWPDKVDEILHRVERHIQIMKEWE